MLDKGLVLSAWEKTRDYGEVTQWAPGKARRLAGRLASRMGASRLGYALDWLNWRQDRDNPRLYLSALFARMNWQAPVLLLPELRERIAAFSGSGNSETLGDLLGLEAWILGSMRDFSSAHDVLDKALEADADSPWLHVQRSVLFEMEDRYGEALEAAGKALGIRPFYRSAVLQKVDSLVHLGRDDEAMELLHQAHEQTEDGEFALRLQAFYSEREDHERGLWCLAEAERRLPLMAAANRRWFAGRRADFLYVAGDFDGCLEWCDRKNEGFQKRMAENLRRPGARERKRRRLDVPFIRQHNMTCAPATLASLAKYWARDHDHLAIAAEICHDGTPWHKERTWAETHGYLAKEFRFTREILVELIDRGIPFTLTTTAVTSAHLQACIGYDDRCDVVLLRDPTHRHYGEMMIEGLVKDHPIQGPRCMMVLPVGEEGRIAGLRFPDEALYEARHQFALALERHDRWKAREALSTMRAIDLEHPLTLDCEGDLSNYLGHRAKALECADRLLERFPNHEILHLRRLNLLKRLGDSGGVQDVLRKAVAKRGWDPVFVSELGENLMEDARQLPLAGYFLRRALRLRRGDGYPLESYARWHDKGGDFARAADLRRLASCVSSSWEPYARAYFDSCRACGRVEAGLSFLEKRCAAKVAAPWMTRAMALHALRRATEEKAVLEEALAAFPEDGELKLQAARLMIGWGDEDRAVGMRWIEEARTKVSEVDWLRHAAECAVYLGERPRAIRLWRELLRSEPQAIDAHQSLARLIAEERGETEALDFLRRATREHPRHPAFWRLLAQWEKAPEEQLRSLDRILELDPDDHWARRERATIRGRTGDAEGALSDAREALARDAGSPESHETLAALLHREGKSEEALASIRQALSLRVDYTYAIGRLMAWSSGQAAREQALAFLEQEMERQVSNGDCLPEYQTAAWSLLSPGDLLARLRTFCGVRPDLWQAWSARLDHALQMDDHTEASLCAEHLTTAFPLMPRSWVEMARVSRARGDQSGELSAFRKALELAPTWDWAARQYSETLERAGRYDEAEQVLRTAIRHEPLTCMNHGLLADLLLKRGKKAEARDSLRAAVDIGPYYSWGWTTLAMLSRELSDEEPFRQRLAKQNTSHGHDAAWWVISAGVHEALDETESALNAVREGLARDPGHAELCDKQAVLLCALGRYEEALASCDAAIGRAEPAREAKGRRAWVLMESGDGPAAIREMTAHLKDEPDYAWGWNQLATWHYARSDWKQLLSASEQWARWCPDQSTAHGHLGLAAERLQDLPKAKAAYLRAFRIDPTYQFAGRRLLSFQIEANEFDEALQTLAGLRHFTPGPWVEYDAIRLALAQKHDGEALEIGRKFCETVVDAEPLACLNQEFGDRGLRERWRQQLEQAVQSGEAVSPAVLSAWADAFTDERSLKAAARRLRRYKMPETARNAAWARLLRAGHGAGDGKLFEVWVGRERKRFRQDADLWNIVGELMLTRGHRREAVKWFRGWEQRANDVGAHTFVNLGAALDGLGNVEDASRVRSEGIARFGREKNTHYHRAAEASYRASQGRIDEAAALLERVEDPYLSEYYLGLASLGRSVVAAAKGDEEEARDHHRAAMGKLVNSTQSPSVKYHFISAEKALAKHVPAGAGKHRKLRKAWGSLEFDTGWCNPLKAGQLPLILLAIVFCFAVIYVGGRTAIGPVLLIGAMAICVFKK